MECVRGWAGTRFESTGVLLVHVSEGTVFGCLAGLCPGLWEFEWTLEIWLVLALPTAVVGALVSLLLWRFAGGNK